MGRFGRAALVLALIAATNAGSLATSEPIRITAIIAVSGRYAILGESQRNALQLAAQQINAAGGVGGRPIEITILDDEAKPDVGQQLVTDAVSKNPVGIIGSNSTAVSAALTRVTNAAKIPTVYLTPSSPLWNTRNGIARYVFEDTPSNITEAPALLGFIENTLHSKKLAVLYDENPYGSEGSALAAAVAPKYGLDIVANESYGSGATDFTAQLGRIKAAGADTILIWGSASAPPLAVKQIRDLGLNVKVIGTTGILSQQFLKVAGPAGEGVYSDSSLNYTHPDAPQRAFLKAYEAAYHETPSNFAAWAYDAVELFAYAIRTSGGKTDPDSIVSAWEHLPRRITLTAGAYQFTPTDHNGVRPSDIHIAVDKNAVWFNL